MHFKSAILSEEPLERVKGRGITMKKVMFLFTGVMLFCGLLLCWVPGSILAQTSKPIKLKAVAAWPLGGTLTIHVETILVDLINKKSNGKLILNFLGGPEVVAKPEQVAAAREGIIDISFGGAGEAWSVIPEISAVSFPASTPWEQRKNGIYDYWVETCKPHNLYYLGRWSYNLSNVFHFRKKVHVERLAHFKGLKIKPIGRLDPLVQELGGANVNISGGEMYTALNTGLLDGFIWSDVGRLSGWEEVVGEVLDNPVSSAANLIALMNLDKWKSLPKHLQDALTGAWVEFEPIAAEHFAKAAGKERKKYMDTGVKFVKLPADEAKWLVESADKLAWNWVKGVLKPESYTKLRKGLLVQP